MAKVTINESTLEAIGSAIRSKLGVETTYKPTQMPAAIRSIETPLLKALTVTENGTYTPTTGWNGFRSVAVNVPNTYLESDEGKVVSGSALVAQTSRTVTENGTYDTTTNNRLVVSIADADAAKGRWF